MTVLYVNISDLLTNFGLCIACYMRYNKDVYKITFINNSLGVYSTGYGYPAPVSSNGTIYIDTESYTVYRYEHCVVRKDRENKRIPVKKYQATHNIVETYKEVNGKYFVNFSNELTREKVISKTNNEVIAVNFYSNTLMSQDIKTDILLELPDPLTILKSRQC